MLVLTGMYRLDQKGVDVLGKLDMGSGSPFGVLFGRPKFWKYAQETVSLVYCS